MDLINAVTVFEELKSKIAEHRTYLASRETVTRVLLVDPVLQLLGWDVRDPNLVELEYRTAEETAERADYILKKAGMPVAVVEAKKLDGSVLTKERKQVKDYADYAGVTWCALTDGSRWLIYDLHEGRNPETMTPKVELDIEKHPSHELALNCLLLWQRNLSSPNGPILAEKPLTGSVVATDTTKVPTPDNEAQEPSEDPLDGQDWLPFAGLSVQKGDRPPTETRIGSNLVELSPYNNWTGFFVGFAKWLVTSSKLGSANCPVFLHEKSGLYLVNVTPRQPKGKEFDAKHEIGGGLWIEKNLDTPGKKRSLTHLLEHCGIDPNSVLVKVD